jgi:hypothetical protein
MPSYPAIRDDKVLYEPSNVYSDKNIKLTLLDGSTLEIWGLAYLNGQPIGTTTANVLQKDLEVAPSLSAGGVNVVAAPSTNPHTGTDVATVFGGITAFPQDVTGSSLPSIGGGYDNKIASSIAGTISGGAHHLIDAPAGHGTIGGGAYQEVHGAYGGALSGFTNKSDSDYGIVAGGRLNIAGDSTDRTGKTDQFVGAGSTNRALGHRALVVGGFNNLAQAQESSILGGTGHLAQTAAIGSAIVGGTSCMTSAPQSTALGNGARAQMYGQVAWASGMFNAVNGDAQASSLVARCITTNATATEMFLDGATATQRMVLPSNATWVFDIMVVARRTDVDDESAGYRITGVIDRNAGAATTALVGTPVVTVLAEDMAAWDVAVNANTTQGALRIMVTGEAAKTIRWVARVELTQLLKA